MISLDNNVIGNTQAKLHKSPQNAVYNCMCLRYVVAGPVGVVLQEDRHVG